MLLLRTHRDAASSSAQPVYLTARPLLVSFRHGIVPHGVVWSQNFLSLSGSSGRAAPHNRSAAHQQTRCTSTGRRQATIEYP